MMTDIKPSAALTFALHTLVAQVLAAATVVLGWQAVQSLAVLTLLSCAVAYAATSLLRMPPSWRLCNTILPLAAAGSLAIELPSWLFLIPFVALVTIYAPALWTRVPYYPTHRAAYALILAELPTDRPFVFLDIGCGFGDLLFFLQSRRPLGTFIGYEIGVVPWLWGTIRARLLRRNSVSIRFQDMWRASLQEYDFVYTFLSPAAMDRMWDKVSCEMGGGSVFITNTFPVPVPADETVAIRDPRNSKLYIHRMGGEQVPARAPILATTLPKTGSLG
jgi:hypothetical protein